MSPGLDHADLDHRPVVVFDADCVLCSRWVHFLLAKERDATLVFVSAWSATGRGFASRHGLDIADLQRTYLFVEGGKARLRSEATLALIGHLRSPWRWLGAFALVPRRLRDTLYDWVARNRYAWFGRKDACFLPPPAARHRFIED